MVNHSAGHMGQEANGDDIGMSFRSSVKLWYVECMQSLELHL